MPQGDKNKYTGKQKRQAEHIEEGYEKRGTPAGEAARRAWATVNKESGGGKLSGSGRAHAKSSTSRSSHASTSRASTSKGSTNEARSQAARKGWATRRRNGS